MKANDFEEKVWSVERVRIVLRCDPNLDVGEYNYQKAADESWRITELLEKRVQKSIDKTIPITTIQGDGEEPHGRVILRTIRGTY